ncbi:MAG: AbrB/MazE/SpoVT family DNA-binding domain-containing protein [Chloroflexi bacterium]|nr:AbrB/MazE/SpoVT family DNA-binding domain-containing protein [Chloroflexota bacterium]
MLTKVQKWGNSRAIRIPKEMALEIGLDFESKIELVLEKGELRIIPVKKPRYTLEELVAGITPENKHEEWDTGPPVGKEIW